MQSAMVADRPQRLGALWSGLRDGVRRRKLTGLGIALLVEALLILLLLSLGVQIAGEEDGRDDVTTLTAVEFAAPPAPEPEPESAAAPQEPQPQAEPVPDQPTPQPLRPSPLSLNQVPAPAQPPAPPQTPAEPAPETPPKRQASPTIAARIRPGRNFGPADTGNPRSVGDSERVGTAANGEPLYAARWYKEPTDQELKGYLSTATAPSYALIACKVVTGYYVEDCQLVAEGPAGSQIGRAVMAASWQFRVRPARIGGREQFGTWVRIRIDYTVNKAR
jgi:protein TonB